MRKKRLLASAGVLIAAAAVAIVPMTSSNAAATCAGAWNSSAIYVKDNVASQNGHNYSAKWWNQNESPATHSGQWDVWADQGTCGGGTTPPPDNPPPNTSGFPLSEAQWNARYPTTSRNAVYTYSGLVEAARSIPAFAGGSDVQKKREVAAFLANTDHESGQFRFAEEIDKSGDYCDETQPYGCPAGNRYFGRGAIQLSWNFNYKAAGDYLGINLLNQPDQVATNPQLAFRTAIWYWMTQSGPNNQSAHAAITGSQGFGGTIRSINGALECDGKRPDIVQNRVNTYLQFAQLLGVDPGGNLYC
jgi:predicted chitinase